MVWTLVYCDIKCNIFNLVNNMTAIQSYITENPCLIKNLKNPEFLELYMEKMDIMSSVTGKKIFMEETKIIFDEYGNFSCFVLGAM